MEVTIEQIVSTETTLIVDMGISARQIAVNPNTNPQVLRELATERDWDLRRLIASNPNTPTDLLWKLGIDFPEAVLANPIFELLQLEQLQLAARIPYDTLTSLLQCDRVPRSFMDYAIGQQDYSLWLAIAYNPRTPGSLLENLARKSRHHDRELIRAVAAHPNTPPQLLAEISEIGHSLAQIVVENPHTPVAVLKKILSEYGHSGGSIFKTLVALHPQLNARLLTQMCLAPNEAAAQSLWLAKQIATESLQLVELAHTTWDVLRLAIVRHPHAPTELVDRIWGQMQIDRSSHRHIAGAEFVQENRLIYDSFVCNPNISPQLRGELRKLLKW
jgi:hypothetical protein